MNEPTPPPIYAGKPAPDPVPMPEADAAGTVPAAASAVSTAYSDHTHTMPSTPKCLPELARLKELEAANARLLSLVGELLVANQQLRERGHP